MRRDLLFLTCLGLLACDAKGEQPAPAATVKGTATAVVTSSAVTASTAAPSASAEGELKPRGPKAYAHPADDAIGTLPEGVGIAVGKKAPNFELKQSDGTVVKLSELLEKSEVLLTFYRGGW